MVVGHAAASSQTVRQVAEVAGISTGAVNPNGGTLGQLLAGAP